MVLALYGHPFSSYTQKALIALYENGTAFEFRCIGPDTPQHVQDWLARWPLAKFPLLLDGDRQVTETSLIIEYLHITHPGPVPLIPADPPAALEVRLMDRVFDLHVMAAVQLAVDTVLGRYPMPRADGLRIAAERLTLAYGWLDGVMQRRDWAAGAEFSMADCAAAPALFYADWVHPIPPAQAALRAYRARLLARPTIARAVDEARPFRHLFPLGAPDRD